MQNFIGIAGATGNLGGRVASALRKRGAAVRALVRPGTAPERLSKLRQHEIEIVEVDLNQPDTLAHALEGSSCVVSTLLGVESTLIGTQSALLNAAVRAGVPRFIPSDYAMDFTKLTPGLNRNLDLHRRFQDIVDAAPIRSTTILNGCFMDLLTGEAPLMLQKIHRILYWGDNPDQLMDFTTIDNTAEFTAEAAIDCNTPRILRIAGQQASARMLAEIAGDAYGRRFSLLRGGGLGRLRTIIRVVRSLSPKNDDPFPVWQGMQYLYCMFEGSGTLSNLDNDRSQSVRWTRIREVLRANH
jgi:uncharacterized protein YbjT (DUF2867 family)